MSVTPVRSYKRLVVTIIIIAALTIAILVYANPPGSGTSISFPPGGTETFPSSSTSTSVTSPDNAGGPGPGPNGPVTLNTVNYAINVAGAEVLIPNASAIGSTYRIVGVQISLRPVNDTTDNGTTWRHWILIFVISNQPFVNGSTLSSTLYSSAITVAEVSSPSRLNSYDSAISFMSPSSACRTSLNNGSVACTTDTQSSPYKLVQVGQTYMVVDPNVPNAYFQIEGIQRGVQIYAGGISYQQMMDLASSMIP